MAVLADRLAAGLSVFLTGQDERAMLMQFLTGPEP
jgi:hypothetical protein